MWLIKSKKVVLTLIAMVIITIGTIIIDDLDKLRWFAAVIGGLIGSYNIGQGIADGCSMGRTSTQKTHAVSNTSTDANGDVSRNLN